MKFTRRHFGLLAAGAAVAHGQKNLRINVPEMPDVNVQLPPLPEKPLQWRDYISLSHLDSPQTTTADWKLISDTLDKLFSPDFEIGQRWLNNFKKNQGDSKEKQVTVYSTRKTQYDFNNTARLLGGWNPEDPKPGVQGNAMIFFNPDTVNDSQYLGVDGQYHDFTPLHTLAHELIGHAAVPNTLGSEYIATAVTNQVIGPEGLKTDVPRGDYGKTRLKSNRINNARPQQQR